MVFILFSTSNCRASLIKQQKKNARRDRHSPLEQYWYKLLLFGSIASDLCTRRMHVSGKKINTNRGCQCCFDVFHSNCIYAKQMSCLPIHMRLDSCVVRGVIYRSTVRCIITNIFFFSSFFFLNISFVCLIIHCMIFFLSPFLRCRRPPSSLAQIENYHAIKFKCKINKFRVEQKKN